MTKYIFHIYIYVQCEIHNTTTLQYYYLTTISCLSHSNHCSFPSQNVDLLVRHYCKTCMTLNTIYATNNYEIPKREGWDYGPYRNLLGHFVITMTSVNPSLQCNDKFIFILVIYIITQYFLSKTDYHQ